MKASRPSGRGKGAAAQVGEITPSKYGHTDGPANDARSSRDVGHAAYVRDGATGLPSVAAGGLLGGDRAMDGAVDTAGWLYTATWSLAERVGVLDERLHHLERLVEVLTGILDAVA